jgi:hypothetical protein
LLVAPWLASADKFPQRAVKPDDLIDRRHRLILLLGGF